MLTPSPHGLSSCCVRHSLPVLIAFIFATCVQMNALYMWKIPLWKKKKVAVIPGDREYTKKHQSKQLRICTWRFLHNAYKKLACLFSDWNTTKYEVMNLISLNEIVSAQLLVTCFRGVGVFGWQEFLPTLVPLTIIKLSPGFSLDKLGLLKYKHYNRSKNCNIH